MKKLSAYGDSIELHSFPDKSIDPTQDALAVVYFIEGILPATVSAKVIDMILETYGKVEDLDNFNPYVDPDDIENEEY